MISNNLISAITTGKDREKVFIAGIGRFGAKVIHNLTKFRLPNIEYDDTAEIKAGSLAIVAIDDNKENILIAEKLIKEVKKSYKCVVGVYFDLCAEDNSRKIEKKLSSLKNKADTLIIGSVGSVHEEIIEFLVFLYLNKCNSEERNSMISNLSNNGFAYFNVVYDKEALHDIYSFSDFATFDTNLKCPLDTSDNLFVMLGYGSAFKLDLDGKIVFSSIEKHLHPNAKIYKFTFLSKRYSPNAIIIQFLVMRKVRN